MKRNSSVEVAFHLFLRGGHEGNVAAASDSLCDEVVHWLTSVLRQDHQQFSQHFKLTVPWCDGGFGDAIADVLEAGHTLSPGSPSGLSTGKFRYITCKIKRVCAATILSRGPVNRGKCSCKQVET